MTVTTLLDRIALPASSLHALLKPVLPLVGGPSDLPVLNAVLIETRGEYLTATATDRFRLGICRVKPDCDKPPVAFRALVAAADLKRLLTIFKPVRGDDPELALSEKDGIFTVTQGGALDGMTGTTIAVACQAGKYPKVRGLITGALAASAHNEPVALNGPFLADFRHAVRGSEPLVVRMGADPRKPILVMAGDHFVGALMTRNPHGPGIADDISAWQSFLGEPESEAVAS